MDRLVAVISVDDTLPRWYLAIKMVLLLTLNSKLQRLGAGLLFVHLKLVAPSRLSFSPLRNRRKAKKCAQGWLAYIRRTQWRDVPSATPASSKDGLAPNSRLVVFTCGW